MENENETVEPPEEGGEETIDKVRAAQRRADKRATEAEAEAAAAKRELTFMRAGVDLDSPVGQLFAKGYDGEIDVEAVKTAWEPVAPHDPSGEPPPAEEPPGGTPSPDDELARLRAERARLTGETSPPGSEPTTPPGRQMMDAAYEAQGGVRARPPAGFNDKALNAGFSALFAAAQSDDAVESGAVFKQPGESWGNATERWRQRES